MIRKAANFLITICLIPFFAAAARAAGGAEIGNGSDDELRFGAAWFGIPERAIKVCYERGDDFPITDAEARRAIQEAFAVWERYARAKPQLGISSRVSLTYELKEKCGENTIFVREDDLVINFGGMDHIIAAAKSRYENPLAFSHRQTFNAETGWGKGLIWIAPPGSVDKASGLPDWSAK
ncbi:MAG TPA: hypothetical protein VFV50_04870, partial [Bdellovibrionales bacterium]|nr:hypothetical protein [Bdellovibrionales bacterium]